MIKSYKDLIVWQKSFRLAVEVYKITKYFPKSELYGLTSQTQRASTSIPSNIAEGSSRGSLNEYIQFLRIAFASGAELETQLLIAKEIGYLKESDFDRLNNSLSEVMSMLNGLIKKLKERRSRD